MRHEALPHDVPYGQPVGDPRVSPHSVGLGGLLHPDAGEPRKRIAVIGGESCGTRLMSRLLARAGCEVLHRSFPYEGAHLRHWPVMPVQQYDPNAYVVMTRDWWAAAQSQVREGHVPSEDVAFANLEEAAYLIAELVHGQWWRQINYEALVRHPQPVVDNLCAWLAIPSVDAGDIYDANEKYLTNSSIGGE